MAQLVTRKARSSVLASAKLYQPARALREDEVLYWRGDLFWPPRGHCRLQKKLHHEDHETDKTPPRTKNTKKTKNTTVRTPGTASPQRCLRDQGPAQPALFETRRASQTQTLRSLACVCVALFVSHPLRGPGRARFRVFVDLRVFVVSFFASASSPLSAVERGHALNRG